MNNQEAFNRMCEHLRGMKTRAINKGASACSYRTRDGRACAVGCLLTDEQARDADRAHKAGSDIAADLGLIADLLDDVQEAHDDWDNWFEDRFIGWHEIERIAKKYGLSIPK